MARFALPDGRIVEAADEAAALAMSRRDKADPKSTYTGELLKQRKALAEGRDQVRSVGLEGVKQFFDTGVQPLAGEFAGAGHALGNTVANIGRRVRGEPVVDSNAIYEANRDAQDEYAKEQRDRYPLTSLGADVAGMFGGGKGLAKGGELLADLKPVVAATKAVKSLPVVQAVTRAVAPVAAAATIAAPRATRLAVQTGKAGLAGAGAGGLLGATEGRTLDERLDNAGEGEVYGALGGALLEGVGAPLAKYGANVAKDTVRPVLDKFKGAAGRKAADVERAATNAAPLLAKRKGVTPESLEAQAARDEGLDLTFAEALGSEGVNMQSSLARRPGNTGDDMRARMRVRNLAQPGGIIADVEQHLGVKPMTAQDDFEALAQKAEEDAGPLWDAATEGEHGVTTPQIEHLLGTDYGQELVAGVKKRAQQ